MSSYTPQVDATHYRRGVYRAKERWASYWHQLDLVRACGPHTVLEVGPGPGVVTTTLRTEGVQVTTCDIAPDLAPDIVGSVTALPAADASYDVVLCAEVLEHIRWDDVPRACAELKRVARGHVVVAVPHPGWVFSLSLKVPLVSRMSFLLQIPFFWHTHTFNGEHYWELGTRGYSLRRFLATAAAAGLVCVRSEKYVDDPVHRFFVFRT